MSDNEANETMEEAGDQNESGSEGESAPPPIETDDQNESGSEGESAPPPIETDDQNESGSEGESAPPPVPSNEAGDQNESSERESPPPPIEDTSQGDSVRESSFDPVNAANVEYPGEDQDPADLEFARQVQGVVENTRKSVHVGHAYDTSTYRLTRDQSQGPGPWPQEYHEYSEYPGEYGHDENRWRVHEYSNYDEDDTDEEHQYGEPLELLDFEEPETYEEASQPLDFEATEMYEDQSEDESYTSSSGDAELMQIPEEPGKEVLDKLAQDLTPRRDPVLKYYPRPEDYPDGIAPSDTDYQSQAPARMDRCPSIESFFRLKKFIEVRFYLLPGGCMISRDCRLDATIFHLKQAISDFVQVPAAHLDLRRKRNLVADNKTLFALGAGPTTKMRFTVEINNRIPGNYSLKLPADNEVYPERTEVRTVTVQMGKGVQKQVQVTIQYATEPNKKLGGYKDTRTGFQTVHASTSPNSIDAEAWETSDMHKGTQSFQGKNSYTQTRQDFAQQMEREDYYVSNARDRHLHARKYVTWEATQVKKSRAITTIQRYWRGWLARQERKRRMDGLIKRVQWAEDIRKGRIEERYAIMDDEIRRQECPRKMVDMELLYRAINRWRKEQEEYVKKNRWGAERKAALAILTEMEADLLLDLERTRKRIMEKGKDSHIEFRYNKMGKPKRWLGSKTDCFITLDTKERQNVRELHQTYKYLKAPVEGEDGLRQRLELLERVNDMIKGISTKLGTMLSSLITRELTYIRIQCSPKMMTSLRTRIAHCFFLLCRDPLFNPEAKMLQKVPFDFTKLRKDMLQCKACRRMQYRDEFSIQRGTTVTSRCHACTELYRTAILRVDLNLYRHMLDELRRDELAAGVSNSVTFMIDAFDMQFLVEQIWHGQSALSGIDNRYLLRLCRWLRKQPWSPWNCVLLTEEEAVSHLQLENLNDAYRDSFFHKVFVKQCTAKTYFEGLGKLAVGLDARIVDGCAKYWEKEKQAKLNREKFKKKARFLRLFTQK